MQLSGAALILAEDVAAYWLAGILTVVAAVIVMVVMLVSDRAGDDERP